jgi:hypothetical protein
MNNDNFIDKMTEALVGKIPNSIPPSQEKLCERWKTEIVSLNWTTGGSSAKHLLLGFLIGNGLAAQEAKSVERYASQFNYWCKGCDCCKYE